MLCGIRATRNGFVDAHEGENLSWDYVNVAFVSISKISAIRPRHTIDTEELDGHWSY